MWADTAYRSAANEAYLADHGKRSQIHRKKPKGKPMSKRTAKANAKKSKVRARVEHVFAQQKERMNLFIRSVGIARAEATITMANIAYNLGRVVTYAVLGAGVAMLGKGAVSAIPDLAAPVRLFSGILIILVVSIGGLVEIVPLIFQSEVRDPAPGIEPYDPLELAGRDVYIREGCYTCHSQMIRPFRDEDMRYGHYSLAAESKYDHPFQWGSKRTGPDLARVGRKYSNAWHTQHLNNPRDVVPESIMPGYPWLLKNQLDYADIADRMRALRVVGVPYSDTEEEYLANVEQFGPALAEQFDIHRAEQSLLAQGQAEDWDGDRTRLTEMDALVAYLQVLGTMVDFSQYDEGYFAEFR